MNKVEKYLVELSECFKGAKATGGIIQMTEVLANEIADGCDGLAKECAQCAMVAQNSTSTNKAMPKLPEFLVLKASVDEWYFEQVENGEVLGWDSDRRLYEYIIAGKIGNS